MAEWNEIVGQKKIDFKMELVAVFAILVSLGFPGNLEMIYGEWIGITMEYAAFFLEIMIMLFSGGKSWMDIRVVNLEKKYTVLYLYVSVIFVTSMLATRYPSLQVVTCTRLVVTLFFAIWLQERLSFKRLLELICIAQALMVLFGLYFMVRYYDIAFESGATYIRALRGLYTTKNTQATELAFGIVVMSVLIRMKRKEWENCRGWIIFWVIQIVLLFMCQATGSIFCLILVWAFFFLPSGFRIPLGWFYIVGSVVFLFATLTLMPAFGWFFEAIGKDPTLTGRIPLWNQIIRVMLENNTFTGYGYGMFWRDPQAYGLIHAAFDENTFLGSMTSGGHNMLLEIWLNDGLIGLTAFFGAILYSMRIVEKLSDNEYLFCCAIMIYLMAIGFTERWASNYNYLTLAFFSVLALCCRRAAEYGKIRGRRNRR